MKLWKDGLIPKATANLTAFIIEMAVVEAQKRGEIPPKREKTDKGK